LAATAHATGRADLMDLALAGVDDVIARDEAGPAGVPLPPPPPPPGEPPVLAHRRRIRYSASDQAGFLGQQRALLRYRRRPRAGVRPRGGGRRRARLR